MKLPRVAVLLLRGLEGCGVTTYARHFQRYFSDNDATCDIFVLKTKKKIGRPETSTDIQFEEFKFEDAADMVSRLNTNYDAAMVFSVPAKTAGDDIVEGYVDQILDRLTIRKVFINHDHSSSSFSRNADYQRAIESCDVTLCHSLQNTRRGFINWMEKNNVKAKVDKLDVFFHVPIVEHLITFDKADRVKRVVCAGRSASWKRTELAFRLHEFSREKDFITEVIGYERSIGVFEFLNEYSKVQKFWVEDPPLWEGDTRGVPCPSYYTNATRNEPVFQYLDRVGQDPNLIYSIGGYKYFTGLGRIARSAYAIHGRTFEFNGLDYGNNMEYQTLECCLLSVPIVHRHFLQTATLPGTDITLDSTGVFVKIDDDNTKSLFGPNIIDPDLLVDRMEDIWQNSYREAREMSVNMIREHYSADVLVPVMLERCGL